MLKQHLSLSVVSCVVVQQLVPNGVSEAPQHLPKLLVALVVEHTAPSTLTEPADVHTPGVRLLVGAVLPPGAM